MKEKFLGYVIYNVSRDEYYLRHLNDVEIDGVILDIFISWHPKSIELKIFDTEFSARETMDIISRDSPDMIEVLELWESKYRIKARLPGRKAH